MNRQAKDILTILRVSGYYDSELTANLLSVVDEKASAKYLKDIDKSFTNVSKHEGIAHELRVIPQGEPTVCEHGKCIDCKHWDIVDVECEKEFVWVYKDDKKVATLNDCYTAENFYCAAFASKHSEPQTV